MKETLHPPSVDDCPDRLAGIERRLADIEHRLGLSPAPPTPALSNGTAPAPPAALSPPADTLRSLSSRGEEIEFAVGQSWFALAGIMALTIGLGLLILLPHARLPALLPPLAGLAVAGLLLTTAHAGKRTFALVSGELYGAGMVLLAIATLRLHFPEPHRLIDSQSLPGQALMALAFLANLLLAWRRHSAWLSMIALGTGVMLALFVNTAGFVLGTVTVMAAGTLLPGPARRTPGLILAAMPLAYATYLIWAMGNPLRGGAYHYVAEPALAPAFPLILVSLFATGLLWRPADDGEDGFRGAATFVNCLLGYGCFLIHTAAAHTARFAWAQTGASLVFLALATAFWLRRQSRVATFLQAMTGYAALTFAIGKAGDIPGVFVWLSLQSLVVVATAVWFRSRFIIVANFAIYVGVVLAYIALAKGESGISVGFGIVALVSARLLNWQRHRLELRTEIMRNAYLLSALFIFPYALRHLVPSRQVGLAWIGLALAYYGMAWFVKNQKYRWMGHATLLLTACYLVLIATRSFDPIFRVLSFLALGSVLLAVSLVFTRLRKSP